MRTAIHTQHFAGVGHRVRASRLARAFRQAHGSVLVFDGGRPFHTAGEDPEAGTGRVQLPPVTWGSQGLEPCGGAASLSAVLASRSRLLVAGLCRLQPDLFLLDSFPFGRWFLRAEVLAGIHRVKAVNSAARVVCSLRDVPRVSRQDPDPATGGHPGDAGRTWPARPGDDGRGEALELLNAHVDAIVVHGDPRVARLDEQVPWAGRLEIPVLYTGYVQQEAPRCKPVPEWQGGGPLVVVSVGGGVNGLSLIALVTAAWGELRRRPSWSAGQMLVFGGALMTATELASAASACQRHGARFERFSSDFPSWLQAADLSISRGGYNTMVAVLAARVRSLVLPAADVSDQAFRVRRLAELGIVDTADEAGLDPPGLAARMSAMLGQPPPGHDLDLAGAERTVELLTALVDERRPAPVPGVPPYADVVQNA